MEGKSGASSAVIPAPQVYSYIVAVKKLVVGSECLASGTVFTVTALRHITVDWLLLLPLTGDGSWLSTCLL